VSEAIVGHKPHTDLVSTYNLHSYDKEKRYWLGQLFSKLKKLGI
jgi:hypothetical protein